jgi:hypothetical protein
MDVQSLFYTLGSIFLILGIVLLVSLGVLIWKAYQTIQKAQEGITVLKDTVQGHISSFAELKTKMLGNSIGMGLASFIFKRVRNMMASRRASSIDPEEL